MVRFRLVSAYWLHHRLWLMVDMVVVTVAVAMVAVNDNYSSPVATTIIPQLGVG